jgi:hypothetical protein
MTPREGNNVARIVIGSYAVQFPLGGYLSWMLQWLYGFQELGHDVYFVEKAAWPNTCYDPVRNVMSDDCSYGVKMIGAMLKRYGLADRWCFVDITGRYHGLSPSHMASIFDSADLFIDMGPHGIWQADATRSRLRVLIDCEPGTIQIKMQKRLEAGEAIPDYDYYYTVGQNVGTAASSAPAAGRQWHRVFDPVAMSLFPFSPADPNSPFTTVMSWQAHAPLEFHGKVYGQKDVEFMKFLDLPRRTPARLEIAVAGNIPKKQLGDAGWQIEDAHAVSISLDAFRQYVVASSGEFSVCKNVFVETNSGFFSERAAAYLASGRPVVMQETGFSHWLPCGRGLFAVRTVEEAAAAIDTIRGDLGRHCVWAREIASEYLATSVVLRRLLDELGL